MISSILHLPLHLLKLLPLRVTQWMVRPSITRLLRLHQRGIVAIFVLERVRPELGVVPSSAGVLSVARPVIGQVVQELLFLLEMAISV